MSIAFAPEADRALLAERMLQSLALEADYAREAEVAASAALPPFGWYPDPAGSAMLRWWNGSGWTDRLEAPRPELQPAAGYSTRALGARNF